MKITMKEVARLAGVSVTTVFRFSIKRAAALAKRRDKGY